MHLPRAAVAAWSVVVLVAVGFTPLVCAAGESESDVLSLLTQPGHVLVLRHASAPGVGDPPGMVPGDCSTQRNLDERGRAQARALGERLRAAGVRAAQIFTSQWCRCRDTAALLGVGPVRELPALNSFFAQPGQRAARIQELTTFLDQLPRDVSGVVLVTHQVTITALTGYVPASGEGLVLKLRDGGGFERVAEVTAVDPNLKE